MIRNGEREQTREQTFAVAVPFFNAEATLNACLQAISEMNPPPDEIWLVDDGSIDGSADIAKKYAGTLIRHSENRGRGQAKNSAYREATTDFIIFIDSDVICRKDTIAILKDHFKTSSTACVSAVPAAVNSFTDFPSRYKAVYMFDILRTFRGAVEFSHGCLQAFRMKDLAELQSTFSATLHCDDIDMGLTLKRQGKNLYLSSRLLPVHERRYTFFELIKNDFKVPFEFSKLILRHGQLFRSVRRGQFAHASIQQIAAIGLTVSALLWLTLGVETARWVAAPAVMVTSLVLRRAFLIECAKRHGVVFALQAALFTWVDQTIMAAGMVCGFVAWYPAKGRLDSAPARFRNKEA
jgi:glycosyltransferase involved in cell wall biosynthesis